MKKIKKEMQIEKEKILIKVNPTYMDTTLNIKEKAIEQL